MQLLLTKTASVQARGRAFATALTLGLLMGAWPSPGGSLPPPARRPPPPRRPATEPPELPGSSAPRLVVPAPTPLRFRAVPTPSEAIPRPTMRTRIDRLGDTPTRLEARRRAAAALRTPGGSGRVARLAAGLGIDAEEAARLLATKVRADQLRTLALRKDPLLRKGVARALKHRPNAAASLLSRLLRDRHLGVIEAAAATAVALGSRRLVPDLAHIALRHPGRIRALALRALAQHPKHPKVQRVLRAALSHRDPLVRRDAIRAVALERVEWARFKLHRLARDRSGVVRAAVAHALGRLVEKWASRKIVYRLTRDRSARVKREAQLALTAWRRVRQRKRSRGRHRRRR